MRILTNIITRVGTIAMLVTMAGCAGDGGDESAEPSAAHTAAPVGVATQAVNGNEWTLQTSDFDSDGLTDFLWFNSATNVAAVWLMQGSRILQRGPYIPGPIGKDWTVAGTSDFNADGMTDILWYHSGTNVMTVWLMQGTRLLQRGPEFPGPAGKGWTIASTSDFDSDGLPDVLWYNADTTVMAIWWMVGDRVAGKGSPVPVATP